MPFDDGLLLFPVFSVHFTLSTTPNFLQWQRYDTDPAAKAAAAAVLASKYTEGTGLKLSLNEESEVDAGKSSDVELVQSRGLRNRKQPQGRASSPGGTMIQNSAETSPQMGSEYDQHNQQVFVDHFQGQGATAYNSGWLSRVAALLVGEDPTQCYALICGNCRMHNGEWFLLMYISLTNPFFRI